MSGKKNILVAPLDWGLGHATRCIPIIRELMSVYQVYIASSGSAAELLKLEFPGLTHLSLPPYKITYPVQRSMTIHMALQLPSIYATIIQEKKRIASLVDEYKIDLVISDNRFGAYSKKVPSVFMTHQVNIKTPKLNKWVNKLNYRAIKKFNSCWIPDDEMNPGLAGELSHPAPEKIPTSYIGPLSRFESGATEKKFDITVVLSGPEPQRTILEDQLFELLFELPDLSINFIRGVYTGRESSMVKNIMVYDHLPSAEIQRILHQSKHIICRSGYSAIMDLQFINAKVLLIPTPQQTEQEYLAELHADESYYFKQKQGYLNLAEFLKARENTIPKKSIEKKSILPLVEKLLIQTS